jgi:hypothetical protein
LAKSLVDSGSERWPLFSTERMIRATEEVYTSLLANNL